MTQAENTVSAFSVVDWNGQKRVEFEGNVDMESTVSEVVAEAVHRLDLPQNVPYSAVVDGRKLNKNESLYDAGLKHNDEIIVTPTVSAG